MEGRSLSAALSWGARRAALKLSERRGARLKLGPSSSGTGGSSSRKPHHPGVRGHGDWQASPEPLLEATGPRH